MEPVAQSRIPHPAETDQGREIRSLSANGHPWRIAAATLCGLLALYGLSRYNYLLFYSIVEIFGIVIAGGIFIVTWHARRQLENSYLLVLGIAAPFIAVLDLLHLLTYSGMGVFPLQSENMPTQFWIAARYLQGFSFLSAVLLSRRKVAVGPMLILLTIVSGCFLASILLWRNFPVCYVEGVGMTAFKKGSEFAVTGIFLGSMALMVRRRNEFDPDVLRLLLVFLAATIGAELLFAAYQGVTDLTDLLGHLLKLIATIFLYRAIVVTALVKPQRILYRELIRREETLKAERNLLKSYLDTAGVIIAVVHADGTIGLLNRKGEAVLGYQSDELAGRDWFGVIFRDNEQEAAKSAFRRLMTEVGEVREERSESRVITKAGETRTILWQNAVLRDGKGNAAALLCSGEDITERRRIEMDRELLIQDLRTALNRVKTLTGLLPICSACKKVRDDKGYWSQVETYVEEHSNAHFTHGLCPDCALRLYPELFKDGMPPEE